eukprot:SAG22_NODE_5275_length_1048_cov_1.418335_2_plen_268_part_01
MRGFHERHADVALQLNVTRHPYSFIGGSKGHQSPGGLRGHDGGPPAETWHDTLLSYMGGDPARREAAEAGMQRLANSAGIKFDYSVLAQWQPVDSQRLLLWAGRFGKQEPFMDALNRRHFQERQSASLPSTLLAAAKEAGLETAAVQRFLETDELVDVVWKSYGETIKQRGIHSIPLFAFSVPEINATGGPFRLPAGPGGDACECCAPDSFLKSANGLFCCDRHRPNEIMTLACTDGSFRRGPRVDGCQLFRGLVRADTARRAGREAR